MQVVKYIGLAHRRRISASDWREAGLEGETVEWSYLNGFAVPVDQFSEDQLREVIEPDRGFVIIGGDEDDVKPRRLSQEMTGQEAHEAPRIDMMGATGARTRSSGSTASSGASDKPSGSGPTPGDGRN